jgi:hypothetical protein
METTRNIVDRNGYIFLPTFRPGASGEVIAPLLGDPVALGQSGFLHRLSPRSERASTPNTYSGMHGLAAFPFHTDLAHYDLPPRYLMLRCVSGFQEVATLLLDGLALVDAIGPTLLGRSLVQPRRARAGRRPLLTLYAPHHGTRGRLRWDAAFIQPASPLGREGCARIATGIAESAPKSIALLHPGDTLVVDNWRMLHARSRVPQQYSGRVIERAYLEALA